NVTVAGKRVVRQYGREAVCDAGEAAVTRSRDVASCDTQAGSRLVNLRMPVSALPPLVADLDPVLVRTIPAGTEGLALLTYYAEIMQREGAIEAFASAEARGLVLAHIYDMVALILGGSRHVVNGVPRISAPAARIRAIKADIVGGADDHTLSVESIAVRHGVS